jgi:predicted Zn finger-like uncharacterized protein
MNDDNLYTRCPTCRTVFRTHEATLEMQSGKVRCGQCRMVFDGRSNLVEVAFDDVAPGEPVVETAGQSAAAVESPAVAARADAPAQVTSATSEPAPAISATNGHAPDIAASVGPAPQIAASIELPFVVEHPIEHTPIDVTPAPEPVDALAAVAPAAAPAQARSKEPAAEPALRHDPVVMPEWKGPTAPPRGKARWAWGTLGVLFAGALIAQLLFHYRNLIAADYPVTRKYLVTACASLRCRIEPLRNRDELIIESHDLQADPAHQGLLILQTTLHNQSRHALAFPHLELELDDNAGAPLVRRGFTPLEYAGGAADFALGIPANGEWNVKLFLDASSVAAGAYKLVHYYP